MGLSYRIREAASDDNEGLLELLRRCPSKGSLQFYHDRQPDFFAMIRVQGDRSFIYVAEDMRGELIGLMVLVDRQEFYQAQLVNVLHIAELRTDPAYRGTRIAAKLVEIYRRKLLDDGYHHGSAEILEGHVLPLKAQRLLGQQIKVCYEGLLNYYQILPLFGYRPSKKYRYRLAESRDLPSLATILRNSYQGQQGMPDFSEENLLRMTEQHSSFGLQNIWLAENEAGEILACLATWDQRNLRRTVAVRFSGLYRFILRLLGLLGLVWTLPPNPELGRPLRCLYARWPACRVDAMPALQQLLRMVMREVRKQKEYQYVAIGFHERDYLRHCLGRIPRLKTKVHLYSHQVLGVEQGQLQLPGSRVSYVDLSVI